MSTINGGSDERSGLLARSTDRLRESVLLKLAVGGVCLIAAATLLQVFVVDPSNPGLVGVWTALLPIWGVGLIVAGLGAYLFVMWRQYRGTE
ncbi:hypothetical protein ACOZ4I_17685 (plasmid) [Haloarcula salina]|uniref:hypothetical protein n=1 Tax=Haloarcula salina TaxID=1429914 RepID=UPI003C6F0FF6